MGLRKGRTMGDIYLELTIANIQDQRRQKEMK